MLIGTYVFLTLIKDENSGFHFNLPGHILSYPVSVFSFEDKKMSNSKIGITENLDKFFKNQKAFDSKINYAKTLDKYYRRRYNTWSTLIAKDQKPSNLMKIYPNHSNQMHKNISVSSKLRTPDINGIHFTSPGHSPLHYNIYLRFINHKIENDICRILCSRKNSRPLDCIIKISVLNDLLSAKKKPKFHSLLQYKQVVIYRCSWLQSKV